MSQALRAGSLYFALAFALGFAGAFLREAMLKLGWGMLTAVLAELLVLMLPATWLLCGWLVRVMGVPAILPPRFVMGGFALGLLLLGEAGLASLIYGVGPGAYFEAQVGSASGIVGLLGQALYALFPAIRLIADSPRPAG